VILATADSNIYVSALQFGGPPLQFLNAARHGAFQLAISGSIIEEVRGVLLNKFHWSDYRLEEAISALRDFTLLVNPTQTVSVAEDSDDNRIIECALTSGSQFIVSGDNDLLRLIQYKDIRILKVVEFLNLIPEPSL
jgi:putative PIN family toxin of toxin-antitoxin system